MAMKSGKGKGSGSGDEAGLAAEAPAPLQHGGRHGGNMSRRYSAAEKRALVEEFEQSEETFGDFCSRHHVSSASLCKWRRALRERGAAGLEAGCNPRNSKGHIGRVRTPEERRQAVEALSKSGLSQKQFARVWGVSPKALHGWLARWRADGPKGLEPRARGPRRPAGGRWPKVPREVRAEIARTKRRFPDFGLRRVRDFLARFGGVRVSTSTVARVLDEEQVVRAGPARKRRRSRALPRRFERARPGELWQSDITSFVIGRARLRVYLIVFLDDYSRFVVSHGLYVYQRAEIAREALLIGIGRFGRPKEVLTDQGRQYFAWRGKSDFQKLLAKQGIHHAVARAHHPETVGKCERLWETLKSEFLDRVELEDLSDARSRLEHFIAHYNFFRPHQGIDGLVPADRFFGAERALRFTHEARLAKDELSLALERAPRRSAYLFGQIGDEQVSVFGERGQLVVHTSSGLRQEIGLDELGAPGAEQEGASHGDADERGLGDGRAGETPAAAAPQQEAAALRGAARDAERSARAVACGAAGGAAACAPDVRGDLGDVAGPQAQGRSGQDAVDPAAAGVAAQPAGFVRYGGGPLEAAPDEAQRGGGDGDERRRPASLEEEDRAARAAAEGSGRPDPALGGAAQAQERAAGIDAVDTGGENAPAQGKIA
jgi:transposase InsO family protein